MVISSVNPKGRYKLFMRKKRKGYGHIDTAWLHYITPPMIISLVVLALLIAGNWTVFVEYYHAAFVLNTVIFVTFGFAISLALGNNTNVRNTAAFLESLDATANKENITDDDIEDLLHRLKTQGRLVNVSDMHAVIHNVQKYSNLVFTEQSARTIKSKMSSRIAEMRKNVSFLGGLMIMLGLIGTYLGLLETVDTVGNVMQKMSSIGGDAGGEGMSTFISELAEPLQGMALAFSASLFGISGSVFVGIFNNRAAHAQIEFTEHVSRWMDDRVPRANDVNAKGDIHLKNMPGSDELKAWLGAFVNLSIQTNRKMGQLLFVMSRSTQAVLKHNATLQQLVNGQNNLQASVKATAGAVAELSAQHQQGAQHADRVERVLSQLHSDMAVSANTQKQELSNVSQSVAHVPSALQQLATSQQDLQDKVDGLGQGGQNIERLEGDMAALTMQLNMILEELNRQNDSIFKEVFYERTSAELNDHDQTHKS